MQAENHPTYEDKRGSFTPLPLSEKWNQVNVSVNTRKFTFRGMHYQEQMPQTKYIKVVQGSIIDFIYDLNKDELTIVKLNNQQSVLVPKDKAHGFLTLEDNTIVTYLTDAAYLPQYEKSIPWHKIRPLSKEILSVGEKMYGSVENGLRELILSDKDKIGK